MDDVSSPEVEDAIRKIMLEELKEIQLKKEDVIDQKNRLLEIAKSEDINSKQVQAKFLGLLSRYLGLKSLDIKQPEYMKPVIDFSTIVLRLTVLLDPTIAGSLDIDVEGMQDLFPMDKNPGDILRKFFDDFDAVRYTDVIGSELSSAIEKFIKAVKPSASA